MIQELIALSIVAIAAFWMTQSIFRKWLADPLAHWALKNGRVKWAMRLRRWSTKKPGCADCH